MTTPRLTKEYLSTKEIPQLFECLMTGLMYHRPEDHITYLQDCLNSIKNQGVTGVRWDMLLESKKIQSPLPPITPTNGLPKNLPNFNNEIPAKSPLPNIKGGDYAVQVSRHTQYLFAITAPGQNLRETVQKIAENFPNFVFINMGSVISKMLTQYAGSKEDLYEEAGERFSRGDLVQDHVVLAALVKEINAHKDSKGFIIHGYPKTKDQIHLFEEKIGPVRFAFIIDVFENQAIDDLSKEFYHSAEFDADLLQHRVEVFKRDTLPACKHLEDAGKLFLVEGERSVKDIIDVAIEALTEELSKTPPQRPSPSPESMGESRDEISDSIPIISPREPDTGRKSDMTEKPIILLFGGPGTGRADVVSHLQSKMPGLQYVNARQLESCDQNDPMVEARDVSISDLKDEINNIANEEDCIGIILEGFPSTEEELNIFNAHIGGPDTCILLDVFEPWMREHLEARGERSGDPSEFQPAVNQRILFYGRNTLQVIRWYDDQDRMHVIFGEGDAAEIADQLIQPIQDVLGEFETMEDLSNANVIFVLGGPGSGKGTQCNKIVEKYGFTHLSSGDLLRAEVESGSDKGQELNSVMEQGELVSLDQVLDLLKSAMLKNMSTSKGFLIDGYPRELEQGVRFENEIAECKCVLVFDVPEDVMRERLVKRGETSGRADDNEDTIMKRFATFREFTAPVIEYYENKGKAYKINAADSIDAIFANVESILDSLDF